MRRTLTIRTLTLALMVAVAFCLAGPMTASAYDEVTRERSDVAQMTRKLGRGLTNILTGWVEVPKTIATKWRETDPVTGFVLGTVQGVGWGFTRTVCGAYETLTFPFPAPGGYEPLMDPEFILPTVWGAETPLTELQLDD